MIEFLQNYKTKAIPPEVFKKGDRPDRSPESEMYFVQLGVAGYVVDGNLVDADYRPIVVAAAEPSDAVTAMGRAGELALGDGTPQRASSGPQFVVRSASLTDAQREALERVLTERGGFEAEVNERDLTIGSLNGLLAERDQSIGDLMRQMTDLTERSNTDSADREREIERLTEELTAANGKVQAAEGEVARLTQELADANAEGGDAAKEVERLTAEVGTLTQQVADLKAKPARGK